MNPTDLPELSKPNFSGSHRRKASNIEISNSKINPKNSENSCFVVFPCFILKVDGILLIPGYEPVHLDLEKLFLLSVSKENLDFRLKNEKTYKNVRKFCRKKINRL